MMRTSNTAVFTCLLLGCGSSNGGTAVPDASTAGDAADSSSPDGSPSPDAAPEDGADAGAVLDEPAISNLPASRHEHEPAVAVAPNGHTVVSWASYTTTPQTITVGYRISRDFGATWGAAALLPLAPDNNVQANATVTADATGALYLAWGAEMVSAGVRSHQRVYLAKAGPTDGQFGTPIEVTDPTLAVGVYDRPHVAVTSSGALNVTYTQASADLMTLLIVDALSTDGGQSWTRTTLAGPGSAGSYRNQARVCHPKDSGRIFMSWVDQDVNGIALIHSDDDGKTWSSGSPLLVSLASDVNTLAYAPTDCVTHGKDVWVLYALSDVAPTSTVSPVFTHLRVAHSGDRGVSVDPAVDAADKQAGAVTLNPTIIAEDDGSLDLAYYSGKAAGDTAATFRRSRSTDGGKTFAPSVLVHAPVKLETSRAVPQWIGDYINGAFLGGNLYLGYADNAAALPHISFYRTQVP